MKPPFIKQSGLYKLPTLVNNVESLTIVPAILMHPLVPLLPSRLGHVNLPSRASLATLHPNLFFKYLPIVLIGYPVDRSSVFSIVIFFKTSCDFSFIICLYGSPASFEKLRLFVFKAFQ